MQLDSRMSTCWDQPSGRDTLGQLPFPCVSAQITAAPTPTPRPASCRLPGDAARGGRGPRQGAAAAWAAGGTAVRSGKMALVMVIGIPFLWEVILPLQI